MASFIAAVAARDAVPHALAIVEAIDTDAGPTYVARELHRLGDAPFDAINAALASEPQYVAQTVVVTTGGQPAADAIHAHGPSAVAVDLGNGADAMTPSAQVLVDTFTRLYRDGAVRVDGALDLGSAAVDALHQAADLANAAAQGDARLPDGTPVDPDRVQSMDAVAYEGDGPLHEDVELSGSAAPLSTERVEAPITPADATAAAVDAQTRVARIAARTHGAEPELGDDRDVALALALAVYYGEASRDELPVTDLADGTHG